MTTTAGFYDDPAVYDVLHAPGTAADVAMLRRIEKRFAGRAGKRVWLEPACGSGRHLRIAAKQGVRVVGFDSSPAMIAYAKSRVEQAAPDARHTLFSADMRRFRLPRSTPRASFAFNLINTIRHLATDRDVLAHFACMARALRPGGVYAVGIGLAAYGVEPPTEDVWTGSRGACRVTQVVEYLPPDRHATGRSARAERVYSHMTITRGRETRDVDSSYTLRTYNLDQWRRLLARTGWVVVAVVDGDARDTTPGEPGYALWILRG